MLSFRNPSLAPALLTLISQTPSLLALLPLASADVSPFQNNSEYLDGEYGTYPMQTFITEPDFLAPVANVLLPPKAGVSPSKYILWTPGGPGVPVAGQGAMLLDAQTMSLVWKGPVLAAETIGASVQTCNGSEYITWFAGTGIDSHKAGINIMFDSEYNNVYNITSLGNLRWADTHEISLTPTCTALITSYQPYARDLSSYTTATNLSFVPSDGWLLESYFQEIDVATNELLFEWNASSHVDVADSFWYPLIEQKQGSASWHAYDFFHLNSVEKDETGNYLLSARHMHALYYVNGRDGSIIWTLGGRKNDFEDLSDGKATYFAYQHHARFVPGSNGTKVSLYDDRGSAYIVEDDALSRGLIISLDLEHMTARLENEYLALHNVTSIREGSMQVLPDATTSTSPKLQTYRPREHAGSSVPAAQNSTKGSVLLGYGDEPGFSEFSAVDGSLLWDVTFGPFKLNRWSADNYRTLKSNFTGHPTWSPKIARGPNTRSGLVVPKGKHNSTWALAAQNLTHSSRNESIYLSWNGATELHSWLLLTSNATNSSAATTDLATLADANLWQQLPRLGAFECSALVGTHARFVRALAVDANDTVLGATPIVEMSSGALLDAQSVDLANATISWQALKADREMRAGGGLLASAGAALSSAVESVKEGVAKGVEKVQESGHAGAILGGLIGTVVSLVGISVAGCVWWRATMRARRGYTSVEDDEETELGGYSKEAGVRIVVVDTDEGRYHDNESRASRSSDEDTEKDDSTLVYDSVEGKDVAEDDAQGDVSLFSIGTLEGDSLLDVDI